MHKHCVGGITYYMHKIIRLVLETIVKMKSLMTKNNALKLEGKMFN